MSRRGRPRGKRKRKGDNFTIPRKKYVYRKSTIRKFMSDRKASRAAFIPYVFINDEEYWLLGSFHDFPRDILTDFGGKCEVRQRVKETGYACAMRELGEESKKVLVGYVFDAIEEGYRDAFEGTFKSAKFEDSVWFVMIELDYEEVKYVPRIFDELSSREKLGPLGFYRKEDIFNGKYRTARNLTDFIRFLKRFSWK